MVQILKKWSKHGGEEGCCCPNREKIGVEKNEAVYSPTFDLGDI
jgi:hypothetical protein